MLFYFRIMVTVMTALLPRYQNIKIITVLKYALYGVIESIFSIVGSETWRVFYLIVSLVDIQ